MILFKICIGERKKNFFLRGGERKNIFWGERRRKENYYFLGERSERKNIEAEGKNFLLLEGKKIFFLEEAKGKIFFFLMEDT